MKKLYFLFFFLATCTFSTAQVFNPLPDWSEEFEKPGLPDTTVWSYDIGGHGWGNNELQFYTKNSENAKVESGNLVITALKDTLEKNRYTSARLVSKNKKNFLYGRFEIRANLPAGVGTWPAIWMLATEDNYGSSYWPDNGELDIMEHVGYDQNVIHANIHSKAFNHTIGTNKGDFVKLRDAFSDYHVYSMDWTPDYISFAVDGVSYFEFQKDENYGWEEWPFNQKFHLLLNIAIGGNWGGQKGIDDSIFPQSMYIDYIRYYKFIN